MEIENTHHKPLIVKSNRTNPSLADIKEIGYSALPMTFGYILETLPPIISIGFMANSDGVAALGLAIMWMCCIGNSVFFSLAAGFEVLAAQANGAKNTKLCSQYYQKGIGLVVILFVVIFIILWYSEEILVQVGIDPYLAGNAMIYMTYAIPSIFFSGVLWIHLAFAQAMNLFKAGMIGSCMGIVVHVLCCLTLIPITGSDLKGTAVASSISYLSNLITVFYYMRQNEQFRQYSSEFDIKEAFSDLFDTFSQSFSMGFIIFLEWLAFECFTFQAGHLSNTNEIAVHVVCYNLFVSYYHAEEGLGMTLTSYVANAVGAGEKRTVKRMSGAGLVLMLGTNFFATICILLFKNDLVGMFFTKEEPAHDIMLHVIPFFIGVIWVDFLQAVLASILRGTGKSREATLVYAICLGVFGEGLAYYLGFVCEYGVVGIWTGIFLADTILNIALILMLSRLDLNRQIQEIRAALKEKGYAEGVTPLQEVLSHRSSVSF